MVTDVRQVSRLSAATDVEPENWLRAFNDTAAAYPHQKMVHELFEEQVQRAPHAVALVHGQKVLTYAELNHRANQLARYLRDRGVGPDGLVGVCVERSHEMVIGVLGILKAGGAYLPLDPHYPAERLQYMLRDAGPRVVLTQSESMSALPATAAETIQLDGNGAQIAERAGENLAAADVGSASQNLVYVIYTSGSTGQPKGTAMPHRAMTNLIEWHRGNLHASAGQRVLQFAALSFDVAFQEIFSTLCAGGVLVLLEERVRRDVAALMELLTDQSINRIFIPPLMLQSLAEFSKSSATTPRCLRDVIAAGEQLRVSAAVVDFFKRLDGARLHNHYGPTETHVVTALTLAGDPAAWPALPAIGRPISNTQIHILDAAGQPAPLATDGEIYIGGASVARGYLNRPELTAARFVRDPFSADPHARLYKTGDLGRWRSDGTIEFLGRNDDQVKVRGYRIELGEIETCLTQHEQVKEAAVVAREDASGARCLVAYVTPGTIAPDVERLRAHVHATLPEHMMPSAFVILRSLPLTPSGKLDRRALPAPDLDAYATRQYEAPQGETEETLARIWQELLQVERVGRQDDFFALGGHSLLIVQMMDRLRQVGLSVEAGRIFENRSLADLASALTTHAAQQFQVPPNLIPLECDAIAPHMLPLVKMQSEQIERIALSVPGGARNIQDIYPLAPLQEGVLFHHMLSDQGGDTYVLPRLFSIPSRQKLESFIAALQKVIDRHDALRTAVVWQGLPRPVQVVYRQARLPVEEIVLDQERDLLEQLKEQMRPEHQKLELQQAPLMRLYVAADVDRAQWYAMLKYHHLACDHESEETLFAEVTACLEGRGQQLPEPMPYRNHVAQALVHARTHDAEAFFRSKLGDMDEPTAPFGLLDVLGGGSRIDEASQVLERALAQRIRRVARRLSVSAATLFHAGWALVIAHTSGRDDVVYGTLLSGRLQGSAGAQRILGMFINTLPLRLRLRDVSAGELVEQTQRELMELLGHEQASLALAQRCSRASGSVPLFSTLLNYLHSRQDLQAERLSLASGIRVLSSPEWTNYPVTAYVDDQGEQFALMMQTDLRIDPRRMLGYLCTAMESLVEALESPSQMPALTLRILPERERRQVLEVFNATQVAYPQEELIHQLFEEQVEHAPAAVAVVYEAQSVTYAELNDRANQLARYLREIGVGPDQLVGVCVERSIEMVVGLLGILKAGGAYVPLDPSYPVERLQEMLQDAAPVALLIQEQTRGLFPNTATPAVALDTDWGEIAQRAKDNQDPRAFGLSSTNLAYVIYTSGSTGKPKGAMNEHRAVINRLRWMQDQYRLGEHDRVLQKTPFTFDVSVWEFFWTLLSGARLIMARPQGHQEPAYLCRLIEQAGVTTLHFVPSMLRIFLDQLRAGACSTVRHVVCSGEELPANVQRKFFECLTHAKLSNLYGPTEAAVDVTFWECRPEDPDDRVPIGRPISNVRMYVLDRSGQPAPLGVTGEIYIGGVGVGRGYLNRPELTAQRFLRDRFAGTPHARMYKTGDLGRWRSDGAIEYLGRNDQQVKMRGFRIEPGEIETQMVGHAHVRDAVVIAREDVAGEKRLVAYVVRRGAHDVANDSIAKTLRSHLQSMLPEYMVPNAFVFLESLPLSPNGKLDRRALPAPTIGAELSQQYEAPRGQVEETVAGFWQELLRVDRVGRHDNFFDLGGHSILAMQLIVRIRDAFSIEMPIRSLIDLPTVSQLSARVEDLRQEGLLDDLNDCSGIEELLARVAAMSESKVQEVVRELRTRGS